MKVRTISTRLGRGLHLYPENEEDLEFLRQENNPYGMVRLEAHSWAADEESNRMVSAFYVRKDTSVCSYDEMFSQAQIDLCELMMKMSQEYFSAGWIDGLEYYLWGILKGHHVGVKRQWKPEQFDELNRLSQETQGWWRIAEDLEEPQYDQSIFMPIRQWEARYEKWCQLQKLGLQKMSKRGVQLGQG